MVDRPCNPAKGRSPRTSADVLLRMENVGRTFQMGELAVEVLRHVSFDIYRGELLVMVGPSGSGKTTLLNIMGGLDTVRRPAGCGLANEELSNASHRPEADSTNRRNSVGVRVPVLQPRGPRPDGARERAGRHRRSSQEPAPTVERALRAGWTGRTG